MKKLRIWAVLLSVMLLGSSVEACGTSQISSQEDGEEWTELLPDSTEESRLEAPRPSRDVVKPRLKHTVQKDTGKRVTEQYKSEFLGTWDGQNSGYVYEFTGSERLNLHGKGWSNTFTYWVQKVGRQVQLHIYDADTEEDHVYPFTKQGGALTLYDDTGSELDVLVRRVTPTPTPSPVPKRTAKPAASPSAGPAASPSPKPSPVLSPSPVPSPTQSIVPVPSPTAAPSPSPSPSPAPIPEELRPAMGKIQCALDVLLGGGDFEGSFWEILARYASQGEFQKDGDYAVLTPEELKACADELFADLTELPECPEDSKVVIHKAADAAAGIPEQYRLQMGNLSDLDLMVEGYVDEVAYIRVEDSSGSRQFAVTLRDGAILLVEEQ